MTPVFQSPERQAALLAEARSWLGTPFVARGRIKEAGVDCVHLPAEIYRALGMLPANYGFPDYNLDSDSHADRSLVTGWLDRRPDFALLRQGFVGQARLAPVEACLSAVGQRQAGLAGDLLAFRIGKVAALYGDMQIVLAFRQKTNVG